MSLETGTFIDDLVSTNPVSATDLVRYGAGHLRLLKDTIKNSFAGAGGNIMTIGADAGTVNSIVITPTPALTEYTTRMIIVWLQLVTNTGATTVNISSLGAKSVVSVANAALASGDLVAGRVYVGIYDGTSVQLEAVTKNYVDQLAFNTVLPAQPGTTTPYKLQTVSGIASWVMDGVTIDSRTSNTILAKDDIGKFINITSGTFSQTFTAAATLGANWSIYIKNSGTGDITLDPNSSETIDGLTSFVMYPGEARLIQCDGSVFTSIVITPFLKTWAALGSFVKPPGYKSFYCELTGGGAGGGGGQGLAAGNIRLGGTGGGGGARHIKTVLASLFGTSETVTIGAGGGGGAGGSSGNGSNGTDGGSSSIGTIIYAYGGGGGRGGQGGSDSYGGSGGGSISAGVVGSTDRVQGGFPSLSISGGGTTSIPAGNGGAYSGGSSVFGGAGGGFNATAGNNASAGGGSVYAGCGGGAGGSMTAANAAADAKNGGKIAEFAAAGGGAGGTGGTGVAGSAGAATGAGGGGGGANTSGTGGVGGAGGSYGDAGGGGGAGTSTGGAGGAGKDGFVIVAGAA